MGNAPNESENIEGSPLVGEDGRTLNDLVDLCLKQRCDVVNAETTEYDTAFREDLIPEDVCDKQIGVDPAYQQAAIDLLMEVTRKYPSLTTGYTNINACIPWKTEKFVRSGVRPLTKIEAVACRPRLLDLIKICKPRAIICLGKEATRFLPKPKEGLPSTVQIVEEIVHPFALNRMEKDDPIRYQECRNRSILTLVRTKRRLWGLEE